jgi:hypothetical protein
MIANVHHQPPIALIISVLQKDRTVMLAQAMWSVIAGIATMFVQFVKMIPAVKPSIQASHIGHPPVKSALQRK